MKQILLILTIVFMSVVALNGEGTQGLEFTLIDRGTAYEVSGGTAQDSHIIIPSIFNELPVTKIAQKAFYRFTNMSSIEIPESITHIGNKAFSRSGLISIELPNSVIEIGGKDKWVDAVYYNGQKSHYEETNPEVFAYCVYLENVVLPKNMLFTHISAGAFRGCTSLKSISIPKTVTHIGNEAFAGSGLISIIIPNNVSQIGDRSSNYATFGPGGNNIANSYQHADVFAECVDLTSVTLPSNPNFTRISSGMFRGTTSLTNISIPNTITHIDNFAFESSGLTSVFIPNSVIELGRSYIIHYFALQVLINASVFANSHSLTSVIFEQPSKITRFSNRTFFGCTSLEHINIPYSVTHFGCEDFRTEWGYWLTSGSVFEGCTSLSTVSFSENSRLHYISDAIFRDCINLNEITLPNSVTNIGRNTFTNTGIWNYNEIDNVVYINDEMENKWAVGTKGTISGSYKLRDNTVGVAGSTFQNQNELTGITIPNSLSQIGIHAFNGCTNLVYVSFDAPSNLSRIGDYSFFNCSSLESIIIPKTVTFIGESAFRRCSGLKSVIFERPSNLSRIGLNAFRDCISITSIDIPSSVQEIMDGAFGDCSGLNYILFENPSSVIRIGSDRLSFNWEERGVFEGCISLSTIDIPSSVQAIGTHAFRSCTNLSKIFIPINVTIIGSHAFLNCPNLTIYTEFENRPSGWHFNWNPDNRTVVWGYVSEDDVVEIPNMSSLLGNFPNPFNPYTSIRYQVSGIKPQNVIINVYNVRGQLIRTLVNDYHEPGEHSVTWNGIDDSGNQVGSGVYFYQMCIRAAMNVVYTVDTRKMMLLK